MATYRVSECDLTGKFIVKRGRTVVGLYRSLDALVKDIDRPFKIVIEGRQMEQQE